MQHIKLSTPKRRPAGSFAESSESVTADNMKDKMSGENESSAVDQNF